MWRMVTNEWLSVREEDSIGLAGQDVYKLLFVKRDGFAERLHTLIQINEYLSYFTVKWKVT